MSHDGKDVVKLWNGIKETKFVTIIGSDKYWPPPPPPPPPHPPPPPPQKKSAETTGASLNQI